MKTVVYRDWLQVHTDDRGCAIQIGSHIIWPEEWCMTPPRVLGYTWRRMLTMFASELVPA